MDAGEWSHFVSLTFPSIEKAVPNLPALRIGADAFELRVDLLEDMSPVSIHRYGMVEWCGGGIYGVHRVVLTCNGSCAFLSVPVVGDWSAVCKL